MRKGLSVALAVAGLLVSGSALAALDLSQPADSFWRWDLGTAVQTIMAACSVATVGIAAWASNTWRKQLTAQHGLDIARRMSIQVAKCQELIPFLYHGAIELMELADDISRDPSRWKESIELEKPYIRNAEENLEALRSLEIEYRAYWNTDDVGWLSPVYRLVEWVVGCHLDAQDDLDEAMEGMVEHSYPRGWVKYRRDHAEEYGITLNKHEALELTRQYLVPARAMLERLNKLKS